MYIYVTCTDWKNQEKLKIEYSVISDRVKAINFISLLSHSTRSVICKCAIEISIIFSNSVPVLFALVLFTYLSLGLLDPPSSEAWLPSIFTMLLAGPLEIYQSYKYNQVEDREHN